MQKQDGCVQELAGKILSHPLEVNEPAPRLLSNFNSYRVISAPGG